jgi:hypothetical protein
MAGLLPTIVGPVFDLCPPRVLLAGTGAGLRGSRARVMILSTSSGSTQ